MALLYFGLLKVSFSHLPELSQMQTSPKNEYSLRGSVEMPQIYYRRSLYSV